MRSNAIELQIGQPSFPLDGSWWFTGDIVDDMINPTHVIYDSTQFATQNVIGYMDPTRKHDLQELEQTDNDAMMMAPIISNEVN